MPPDRPAPDAARVLPGPVTTRRILDEAGRISTATIARIEADHDWYRALSAEDRSWVGLVAQAGVAGFLAWLRDPAATATLAVFGTAPRELTRSISLGHTLDLLRSAVGVVEDEVTALAEPHEEATVREAVLRYSREIAFAAAQVYAEAAEVRGAWDARLESLVLDAVLRGLADDSLRSRAAALGWDSVRNVTAVVGPARDRDTSRLIEDVHRGARRLDAEALAGVQGRRLLVVLGGPEDAPAVIGRLLALFGDGPVVHGMTVPHLFAAGRSTRSALAGYAAAPAWPAAPRPCSAEALLPERAISGEERARRALADGCYRALVHSGGGLLETAEAYLGTGQLEATARELFVHPNTVRYRLGKIAQVTGYDLMRARDAYAARLGIALGRLTESAGA